MKTRSPKKGKGPARMPALVPVLALVLYAGCLLGFQLWGGEKPAQDFLLVSEGFTDRTIDSAESALAAIGDLSGQLGIAEPGAVFSDCQETAAGDNTYYRFAQSYQGIPVYGRSLVVGADENGTGLLASGNYLDPGQMETTPQVEQDAAVEAAAERYGQDAAVVSQGLTIYSLNGCTPELAWQMEVTSGAAQDLCFVSAVDGEILDTQPLGRNQQVLCAGRDLSGDMVSFYAEYQDGVYEMLDEERQIYIYDANGGTSQYTTVVVDSEGNVYRSQKGQWYDAENHKVTIEGTDGSFEVRDEAGNVIGTYGAYAVEMRAGLVLDVWEKDQANRHLITGQEQRVVSDSQIWDDPEAVTVMHLLSQTYDFWAGPPMNRNGFNGRGGAIIANFNDDLNGDPTNSRALPVQAIGMGLISFGEDCTLTLDLVSHEYTHLITDSVAGLAGGPESGAIDEALSDIFGEIVEASAYGSCDWKNDERDLVNPKQSRNADYPDTYQGENWVFPEDQDHDGGEHVNSVVLSHAAYLMNTGIGGDSRFEPLSTTDLAQLFYQTLQTLPADCTFPEFRTLTQHAAQVMQQQGKLSDLQVQCVSYAFFQAGIPSAEETPVAPQVKVTVYGVNGTPYEDCILYVSDGRSVTQYDGADLDTVQVDLSGAGQYELLVVDQANPDNKTSRTVTVVSHGGLPSLDIATECGVTEMPEDLIVRDWDDAPLKAQLAQLVQTYGLFSTDQTGQVSVDNFNPWLSPDGIMGAQILDYDLDGSPEMLVCRAESCPENTYYGSSHIVMEIYEMEAGQAVCRASQVMEAYNPSPYEASWYKEVLLDPLSTSEDVVAVHTVWSEGKPYLLCEYRSYASAFGDGVDQACWMLEYTGETLENTASYTQTGAGSTDFQFMGYRFTDGAETDAQLYYSEPYGGGLYSRYGEGIQAFFDPYGIQLADWVRDSRQVGDTVRQFQSFLSPDNQMEQVFLYSCQETSFENRVHTFAARLDRDGALLEESLQTAPEQASE